METETHTDLRGSLPEPNRANHNGLPCAACHPRQYAAESATHRAPTRLRTRPVTAPRGRHQARG